VVGKLLGTNGLGANVLANVLQVNIVVELMAGELLVTDGLDAECMLCGISIVLLSNWDLRGSTLG